MRIEHNRKRLAALNQALFDLVATFPKAKTELVDFHIKHSVEDYIESIREFPGRKAIRIVGSPVEAAGAIRRGLIAADLVCFSVDEWVKPSGYSVFPISDELASPVLGASASIDPKTGSRLGFAPARDWLVAMVAKMIASADVSSETALLAADWSGKGTSRWNRTMSSRLADPSINAHGEHCHLAGGFLHVAIPQENQFLEDCQPLMVSGQVAFTPFISPGINAASVGEDVLKADVLGATHLSDLSETLKPPDEDPLLRLEIPFLENIPLPLLAKVLEDEAESLTAFRRKLDRAIEDASNAKDTTEAAKQLKRDLLEDELEKVRHTCNRLARMNSIARSGAYVASTALTIAAVHGLALPSVIAGCSAPIAAAIKALWDSHETKRETRRSPAYFVWRIERGARKR